MVSLALGMLLAVQQPPIQSTSTPYHGDTAGYWQQRVAYTVVATLDETAGTLHGSATLVYVNNSPDTLRELYFQQYLNAFRPGSKWSAYDEREMRVRYQDLPDPYFGYERLTATPMVNGRAVVAEYPGAPDSTVFRLKLPVALPPHD